MVKTERGCKWLWAAEKSCGGEESDQRLRAGNKPPGGLVLLCTIWLARCCPDIRAPRKSLLLRSPSSAQLSRFPIHQSRGEHTPPWRKFALRWTCTITAFAFGKKVAWFIKHYCVHYRQKKKSKDKKSWMWNFNITLPLHSLPGSTKLYRFAIGLLQGVTHNAQNFRF